jgi:hypothetical protein
LMPGSTWTLLWMRKDNNVTSSKLLTLTTANHHSCKNAILNSSSS